VFPGAPRRGGSCQRAKPGFWQILEGPGTHGKSYSTQLRMKCRHPRDADRPCWQPERRPQPSFASSNARAVRSQRWRCSADMER
jgi:hypothetical protein